MPRVLLFKCPIVAYEALRYVSSSSFHIFPGLLELLSFRKFVCFEKSAVQVLSAFVKRLR